MIAIAEANGIMRTVHPYILVVRLGGRVFGVTGDLLQDAREEESRDCRDTLFEQFTKGELGEWDGVDGGRKQSTAAGSVLTMIQVMQTE